MIKNVKIATVYRRHLYDEFSPCKMDLIRWLRISESLARLGYKVDMIINTKEGLVHRNRNLRFVPYSDVDWDRYHIIKILFHGGFESFSIEGHEDHPFIICKLGSVVGAKDGVEGVHFFGEERRSLYEIQNRINQRSKFITILTEPSIRLWKKEYGDRRNILMVPTGVDRVIPPPKRNPYDAFGEKIAVYLGNIYENAQKEVNAIWQDRLNQVGKLLRRRGIGCVLSASEI